MATGTSVRCSNCGIIESVLANACRAHKEKPVKETPALAGEFQTPYSGVFRREEIAVMDSLFEVPHIPVEDTEAIGDRIKVRILKLREKVEGTMLHRPETAIGVPFQGLVLSTGRGIISNGVLFPLEVKVGDILHFQKYGGHEIEVSGQAVMMLRENEVQLRTPKEKWMAALARERAAQDHPTEE
jgi:co-chaperonin GroES (HSP10)